MKNVRFMYVATLLCVLFLTSCNKDQQNPNIVDLPVSVGTNWKYIVYDSIHNYTDTQTVTITGATTMADGRSAKIVTSYAIFMAGSQYTYLVEDANKATFYTSQEGKDYNKIYVYP